MMHWSLPKIKNERLVFCCKQLVAAHGLVFVMALSFACTQTPQQLLQGSPTTSPSQIEAATINQPTHLKIAMIPSQNSAEETKQRQLLADYLQEQLELSVTIEVPQDYGAAIDLLVENKVQIAYLGPFSYVKAQQRNALLEPIVAPIDKRTGRPWYTSVIVANTAQGINKLEDLQGKRFSFVSQSSTSGYLVPLAQLKELGIDPQQDFAATSYAGSHNQNLAALTSGAVDAIGINKPTYLNAQKAGELAPEQYKVLWESDPIPNAPIVISSRLPSQFKLALQKALLDAPAGLAALSGAKSDGYTLVEDKDYDAIRQLQATLAIEIND